MNFRHILLIALLFILGSACTNTGINRDSPPVNSIDPQAQFATIPPAAEARIVPHQFRFLSFQTGGVVAEVLVEEGALVAEGQPLIRLSSPEFEAMLAQADSAVTQAQAGLAQAIASQAQAEAHMLQTTAGITTAESVIEQAHALETQAWQAVVQAEEALTQVEIAEEQTFGDTAIEIAESQTKQAESAVISAEAGYFAAQAGVDQATANLTIAESALVVAETGLLQATAGITQAQAILDQAIANQTVAQANIDKMSINAPFAGTVADIQTKSGELATPGIPVLVLADFSEWQVETADLSELDVVKLSVGDPVNVSLDALPDVNLVGTVIQIAHLSQFIQGDVTYQLIIELDQSELSDLPLRWGMTAFVEAQE